MPLTVIQTMPARYAVKKPIVAAIIISSIIGLFVVYFI